MAAALDALADMSVGDTLKVTGTGFALTHAYTAVVKLPGPGQPSITLKGTTSGAGAVDTSAVADLQVGHEGEVEVTVNDGTSTVVETVRVWHSS